MTDDDDSEVGRLRARVARQGQVIASVLDDLYFIEIKGERLTAIEKIIYGRLSRHFEKENDIIKEQIRKLRCAK